MTIEICIGDVRAELSKIADDSIDCVVTSPPYWGHRDYGVIGQIGLEPTLKDYIETIVAVFEDVRRVLKPEGTLWLNLGDSYAGNWGAEKRGASDNGTSSLSDRSMVAMPKGVHTGSTKRTGLKPKDLCMVPNRIAIAMQDAGWWVRSEIIWAKPNPMPESVTDRPTQSHEKIWLMSKSARYFYDAEAVREPADESSIQRWAQDIESQTGLYGANGGQKTNGTMKAVGGKALPEKERRSKSDKQRGHGRRHAGFNDRWDHMTKEEQQSFGRNCRNVWTIATKPFCEAHFATFPPELAERCIKAGCPVGGTVLDPFGGAGTTGLVADRLGRNAILIELNPAYAEIAKNRIQSDCPMFSKIAVRVCQ